MFIRGHSHTTISGKGVRQSSLRLGGGVVRHFNFILYLYMNRHTPLLLLIVGTDDDDDDDGWWLFAHVEVVCEETQGKGWTAQELDSSPLAVLRSLRFGVTRLEISLPSLLRPAAFSSPALTLALSLSNSLCIGLIISFHTCPCLRRRRRPFVWFVYRCIHSLLQVALFLW